MKKTIIWIVIIVAVVGVLAWSNQNKGSQTTGESLKIGVILPLSGDFAVLGEEIKRGIETAASEAKKDDRNIEVVFEDDQSLVPAVTVSAARKLVNIDKVDVGLTMLVEELRPIAPVFNETKVPILVMWDSNEFIKNSGKYTFSNGFSTEKAGELAADYMDDLGIKEVAIINHTDHWSEIISEAFAKKFAELGGKVVLKEQLAGDTIDFRTVLTKLKNSTAEGAYIPLIPPGSAKFLTQAKELKISMPFISGDALIADVIAEAGPAVEGVYYTNYFTEKTTELAQKYKTIYNADPIDVTLYSFGYDGIMQLIEARNRGNGDVFEGLQELYGPNRATDRLEKLYQIRNGQPVEVK